MIIVDVEQQTRDWYMEKNGVPSASNFDKIITASGDQSKQRQAYLYQLAGQKVSGTQDAGFQSAGMLRGIEMEAEARNLYELVTDAKIQRVGVCFRDERKLYGCSPDGLIGKSGLLEIKCPFVQTHVGYLMKGVLPLEYFVQTQGQLLVTERPWVDFISYYPGIRPLTVRVKRDRKFLPKLEAELDLFCRDLKKTVSKIKGLK